MVEKVHAHREICGLCHRVVAVSFWVPDDVWEAVVHRSRLQDIHCLNCFIERADEKLVAWDRGIQFYPVSLRTHIEAVVLTDEPRDRLLDNDPPIERRSLGDTRR